MADSSQNKESPLDQKASKLSVTSYLPSIKFLSLLIILFIGVGFFVLPLLQTDKASWSSGKLSTNHKLLEKNCAACHGESFSEVKDQSCMSCHNSNSFEHASHSNFIAEHANLTQSCRSCHFEHKGEQSIISPDDRLCTSCHTNITKTKEDSKLENVSKFLTHPKIKLPEDKGLLKLNHAIHLKRNIKGPDGPVTLNCSTCHKIAGDGKIFLPVTYENNCQSCHPLTFDEKIPDVKAPHGDSDAVVNFIFGAYSKRAVTNSYVETSKGIETLRNPSDGKPTFYNQEKILSDTRDSEKLLFTKTGCVLCHVVEPTVPSESNDAVTLQSNFKVIEPHTPIQWLKRASFSHSAHTEMKCDSCHANVTKSEDSKDVLIPDIDNCKKCHAGPVNTYDLNHSGLNSNCVTCHGYHNAQLDAVSTTNLLSSILRGKK